MSRDKYNISSLEVVTDQNRPVGNSIIQQPKSSEKLAVIYPGLRYTCDKPLLHYATEILLDQGYDVLQLWADYDNPDFQNASQAERTVQLIEEGKALLQAGLQAASYRHLVLVGKSLGTLTMAFILSEKPDLPRLMTIWLTPLLYLPPVANIILELDKPAFVAGSEADHTFEFENFAQVSSKSNIELHRIAGADHSLEVPGDPLKSTKILSELMANLTAFLT